jgi:hypothetical protein
LFVAAVFAGPDASERPQPGPSASALPTGEASSPSPSAAPAPTPTVAASPVASVDQIVVEEVGDYLLVDRRPATDLAERGAVEAVELRYEQAPHLDGTEVFHAIEIHVDAGAADDRVRVFAESMGASGFTVVREQPLRSDAGRRQGYFIALTDDDNQLLLWSNENATFSLGAGDGVEIDDFYEMLPY